MIRAEALNASLEDSVQMEALHIKGVSNLLVANAASSTAVAGATMIGHAHIG
jgi:hypothetical protein